MAGIEQYLDECYREEFARVVAAWLPGDVKKHVEDQWGYIEMAASATILRLENERGCISCGVKPRDDEHFIAVDDLIRIMDRFANRAATGPGVRRHTLREQCDALVNRRDEVLRSLSREYSETRHATLKAFQQEYWANLTRTSNNFPQPSPPSRRG